MLSNCADTTKLPACGFITHELMVVWVKVRNHRIKWAGVEV